jgi:C-terminal processing protease CtpA/Prc
LAQFRVLLDIPAGKLYLKPNSSEVGVGLDAELNEGGSLLITGVTPKSPADEAGLKVGDEIVEVGGKPVKDLTPEQIGAEVRKPEGAEVLLKVKAKGADTVREVRLKPRKL